MGWLFNKKCVKLKRFYNALGDSIKCIKTKRKLIPPGTALALSSQQRY